ncbi:cordon-bleu protein-like 1 isoform X1 [Fukomys damarensis]|uniref:cordon-bleu protein-like 1 isoform X1 n=1 Tax=Fukomys damarensis TaxID=885580 RepID=UPI00053FC1CF|nr:cordon-bleu protein-like 1 isoform X1 [Fukomys damarensis]
MRKTKAKAPLPPSETKYVDVSSIDDSVESAAFVMEQKENILDKDIDLTVVLPGDIIKSTTVRGSKPMMDLLIFLCAQYHLNPSSYTIDLLSAEKHNIKFKPNTPIGMLDVEKVILKPKNLDKKKPTPIIPEKTVRVVINFKKTQKTIVRVSPHASLQELVPIICSKCEFDPLHTLLLKDYQSQEPLDLTVSLNDLGLRELYAMDISGESSQISPNLDIMKEKENKGFFSFFQRSKKKREQTSSAPATPLINKHRPTFVRSNTLSRQYVSNTLPSDVPKKRRAPLPPMLASQSVPQDLEQAQEKLGSSVSKSTGVEEAEKSPCEVIRMRTGSLQLTSTSEGNSTLKRTKRKAPSPPSKISLHQSDENGHVTALQAGDGISPDSASEATSPEGLPSPDSTSLAEGSLGPGLFYQEHCTSPKLPDETSLSEGPGTPEAAVASWTSGVSSDYSLEEIDEKEELSEVPKNEAEDISPKLPDIPFVSTDIINTLTKDPDSDFGTDRGEASHNSKEKNQEAKNTDGPGAHDVVYDTSYEDMVADRVRNLHSLGPNEKNVQNETSVLETKTEDTMKNSVRKTEICVEDEAERKDMNMGADKPSKCQARESECFVSSKENLQAVASVPDQKLNQPRAEKTKMQDAAIQATPSCNSFGGNHQGHHLPDESVQTSNNKSTQHSALSLQDSVDASSRLRSQGSLLLHPEDKPARKDSVYAYGNDDLSSPVDMDKNSAISYLKNAPLYRQDYNPKPKPSNEITREYIPKIGMTTYKIVPPKSLEIQKDWESETIVFKDNLKINTLGEKNTSENVKETSIQTENTATSEGPVKPEQDLKPKRNLRTQHQLHRAMSFPDGAVTHPLKPPRITGDAGVPPFAPTLEDINNILESKIKSRASNPQAKPNSFFLQMQKRATGHYVTSAAAKNTHAAPNSTTKELPNKDVERDTLPSPEQPLSPLSETTPCTPQPHIKNAHDTIITQKPAPPPIAPKPVPLPTTQPAAVNLKTLKAFGAPRPFSSSAPSPFALAVVKRSQSFSRVRTESSSEAGSAQPPASTEDEKTCSINKFSDTPHLDVTEKQNSSAHNEQNSQMPTPTDCPSFTLKKQSSLAFQSSDPEQIRQSLLTAIRSGEAAAKLKRVTVPSNTISVNGRSGLSHCLSPDAQEGC